MKKTEQEKGTEQVLTNSSLQLKAVADQSKITVNVAGNPTTGYEWTVEDTQSLKCVVSDYVADPVDKEIVGAGGVYHFELIAKHPGTYTVDFKYARSWEEQSAASFSIRATINENLIITAMEIL
ncbi:MAG: protease inhibitor I42 family protein [Sphaerochaetaceae bacterium]|nr:protease inhibitor I42 family protein [Sphaerochaetaceae bacterium]